MTAKEVPKITNKMLMDEINILREEVKEVHTLKKRIAVLEQGEYNPKRTDDQSKLVNQETSKTLDKCKVSEESFSSRSCLKKHLVENHPSRIKCNECETIHIKKNHEHTVQHSCDICGTKFVLKWRLKKHTDGHSNKSQQYCITMIMIKPVLIRKKAVNLNIIIQKNVLLILIVKKNFANLNKQMF